MTKAGKYTEDLVLSSRYLLWLTTHWSGDIAVFMDSIMHGNAPQWETPPAHSMTVFGPHALVQLNLPGIIWCFLPPFGLLQFDLHAKQITAQNSCSTSTTSCIILIKRDDDDDD
jgi:hypothetical protein